MSFVSLLTLYVAGLASFLSPCVLPLVPSYLAILGGAGASPSGRLRRAGIGFALGLSLVFIVFGLSASAVALALGAHRRALMVIAGVLMLLFGAKLLGVLRWRALDGEARPLLLRIPSPGGFWGGLLFGAAFSLGWTPCVGPVLGATLSYAASHSASPLSAGAELAVYALGLSTPLIAATFAAEHVLAITRRLRGILLLTQRAVGAVLVIMGLLLATDHLSAVVPAASSAKAAQSAAPTPNSCNGAGNTPCALPEAAAPETADDSAALANLPLGRPHLLEFVSEHCAMCARMAPLVAELEHICTDGDGTIVRANVESASGRALAQRFGVHAVPTFLQLDSQGREVERVIGEQSRAELELALQNVRGAACRSL
jgi:cytochrome c-type biogenesis protein